MQQLFKFAGAVIDCYDDPAFIDNINAQTMFSRNVLAGPDQLASLPDSCFAVKIAGKTGYHRRLPVYNDVITKISCLYYDSNYTNLPVEIQRAAGYSLAQACDKYGIEKCASVARHADSPAPTVVEYITKEAAAPSFNSLDEMRKYAEFRLANELPKMHLINRTPAATELYKSAGEEAITRQDVWDYVEKPVSGPLLEGALDDRESIAKSASRELQYMFEQVREQVENADPAEAVSILSAFDKYAELDTRYRDGLTDPYVAVYGGWPLPAIRKRNESWQIEKEAAVPSVYTGATMTAEEATQLSVEEHVHNLQRAFPKASAAFTKQAALVLPTNIAEKWGKNYVNARKLYFGA